MTQKEHTSLGDLTAIGGAEVYESFMKDYTDLDPYSDYARAYAVEAIDRQKDLKDYDASSNLYRLIASQKTEQVEDLYDSFHYETEDLIGFIRKI